METVVLGVPIILATMTVCDGYICIASRWE
jgi:hypothetical protein